MTMHATDVIGYSYDADHHCEDCTFMRFYNETDLTDVQDSEGNPIHPIFASDEWWEPSIDEPQTLNCDDCGAELDTIEGTDA